MSRAHNARNRITGLLRYRGGDIMQALEGEDERVRTLLATIERDPRHRRVMVIHDETCGERAPVRRWSMGFRDLAHAAPAEVDGGNRCVSGRRAGGLPEDADRAVVQFVERFRQAR